MAKRTLLDMTQGILRSLKLDEVNSITSTDDAVDVSYVIRDTYFDLLTNRLIPEHYELSSFTSLADSTKPTILLMPDNMETLDWVKYDKRASATDTRLRFEDVAYMTPEQFILMSNGRDSTDTTNNGTSTLPTSGKTIIYKKLVNPEYWTSFDDEYIVFDGVDTTIDSTLQESKLQCYGKVEPVFTIADAFIPDLDTNLFPLLYNTAKAVASLEMKKEPNPAANAISRTQAVASQNRRHTFSDRNLPSRPNFGRK